MQYTFEELLKKANDGDSAFQHIVGRLYERGEGGIAQDFQKAYYYYAKSSNGGNAYGACALGLFLMDGIACAKDEKEGLRLITLSAECNIAEAQEYLAKCYREGRLLPKNLALADEWSKKAQTGARITTTTESPSAQKSSLSTAKASRLLDSIRRSKNSADELNRAYFGFTPVSNPAYNINREKGPLVLFLESVQALYDTPVGKETDYDGEDDESLYRKAVCIRHRDQYAYLRQGEYLPLLKQSAQKGNDKANFLLGFIFTTEYDKMDSYTRGTAPFETAKGYFTEAMNLGNAHAICALGFTFGKYEQDKSASYFIEAMNLGVSDAEKYLATIPQNDIEKGLTIYRDKIFASVLESGDAQALKKIADYFLSPEGRWDFDKALIYLEKMEGLDDALTKGNALDGETLFNMALCYSRTYPRTDGREKAKKYLLASANAGYIRAMTEIAVNKHFFTPYEKVITLLNASEIEGSAEEWLQRAIDYGYSEAKTFLYQINPLQEVTDAERSGDIDAMINAYKRFNQHDKLKALYERECQNGNAQFELTLADIYFKSWNETEKAIPLYLKHEESAWACLQVALYYSRFSPEKDYEKAMEYLEKADTVLKISHVPSIEASVNEIRKSLLDNRCPSCNKYFTKTAKKTLFGTKYFCSNCGAKLK